MTLLHLSYLANYYGEQDQSKMWLDKALAKSPDCVFPSFPESVAVLRAAIEKRPDNGKLQQYQGNLLAGLGRIDEAVAAWRKAADLDKGLSVAWHNLAMNAWKKDNDLARANECFAKAIEARPKDETLYRDRALVLVEMKRPDEAIKLLEGRPTDENPRTDAAVLLAKTYVDEKRYKDALNLLEKSSFNNWEGQMDSWNLFNRSHIEIGKADFDKRAYSDALAHFSAALTYPENLRVGRPASPKEAEAQYWKGRALRALDRADEALAAWKSGAEEDSEKAESKYRDMCKQALELLEKNQ
jgi:tetratricopeptide (TPR) repeat protein